MKKIIFVSFLLLLAAILIPLVFAERPLHAETPGGTGTAAENPSAEESWDARQQVRVQDGQEIETVTLRDYLPGVLAGEMPASFEPEALKAQAVAARTYILYCRQRTNTAHPEADVCNDAACCKAYVSEEQLRSQWGDAYAANMEKIQSAVQETDGVYLTYDGEPIQAVFHSSSAGRTEDSGNLWSEVPYLVSVESPESEQMVPNYVSTVEMSPEEFKSSLLEQAPDADLSGDPAGWITDVQYNATGRVASMDIGGQTLTGGQARTAFGLRAAAFQVQYTGAAFRFTVTGYGHGVGMSQYGANAMAQNGADYREILLHYYTGVQLSEND